MERRRFLQSLLAAAATGLFGRPRPAVAAPAAAPAAGVVDFYCHFSSLRAIDFLESHGGSRPHPFRALFANTAELIDPDRRLALMEECGVAHSVLVPLPWLETAPAVWSDPRRCLEAARLLNDDLAATAARHPDRFTAVAVLPTTNRDVLLAEFRRALDDLGMAGGLFVVGPTVKRPDHPDLEALYAEAEKRDAPLWIHPSRPATVPDYADERESRYQIWQTLSWLQDSSAAMVRIVFAGVFERHPALKLVTHHHGALVPLFAQRMQYGWDYFEQNTGRRQPTTIRPPYIEHFRNFYCDTATQGIAPQMIETAVSFFGAERVLFGSDAPMDASGGRHFTRDALASVGRAGLRAEEKEKILRRNALRLLKRAEIPGKA
ncbi:MAG: amidohydrolase family protein [Desulfobacterales bacterium]